MDDLRKIVDEATPGPWFTAGQGATAYFIDAAPHPLDPVSCYPVAETAIEPDATFIATFDPVLVSALLDVADAAAWADQAIPTQGPGDMRRFESSLVRLSDLRSLVAALDRLEEVRRD